MTADYYAVGVCDTTMEGMTVREGMSEGGGTMVS